MLCLACYQDRLASVLDNAVEFRLYGHDGDNIYPAGCLTLPSTDLVDRTLAMAARGVTHLVCGAVSRASGASLERAGIRCTAWVRGSVGEVLEGVRTGRLDRLAMPGCRVGHGHGGHGHGGPGRGGHGHGHGIGSGGHGSGPHGRGPGGE